MEVIRNTQLEQERERIERVRDEDFKRSVVKRFEQTSVIRSARRSARRSKSISYACNAFSFILASYAVFYFTSMYSGWLFAGLLALGVVLLGAWEWGKRISAIAFFEGLYNSDERSKMWAGIGLLILVIGSMGATYYGGERLVIEENTGPAVVHNTQIDSINNAIAVARKDYELMKKQTWGGKIVRDARKQMNTLQNRIDVLLSQKLALENRDMAENDGIKQKHESKMQNLGFVFGGIGAIMDILLVLLLGFAERKEWEVFCLTRSQAGTKAPDASVKGTESRSKRSDVIRSKRSERKAVASAKSAPIGFKVHTDASVNATVKRSCLNCGTDISSKRSDAKYCCSNCRKEYWENKH